MRYIGDSHAKFTQYVELTQDCPASIQVGDFGIGFKEVPEVGPGHRFIRGNHDSPELARRHPHWIPDGHVEDDHFFLGGGESIDRAMRTEGKDWWADEQLSMNELYELMDVYEAAKPRVVVTHECPSDVACLLFNHVRYRELNPSRTSQALSSLLFIHRPEVWIFGHWHQRRDQVIEGTRFICLEELGTIDL
jgi:predicted phosphodiesterase